MCGSGPNQHTQDFENQTHRPPPRSQTDRVGEEVPRIQTALQKQPQPTEGLLGIQGLTQQGHLLTKTKTSTFSVGLKQDPECHTSSSKYPEYNPKLLALQKIRKISILKGIDNQQTPTAK